MKKILTSLVSATMLLSMSTTLAHAQNISLGANVNADTTSPSGIRLHSIMIQVMIQNGQINLK